MFRSLIHFEFIFVYGVRKCSSFILLQVVDQFSQHHLLKRLYFSTLPNHQLGEGQFKSLGELDRWPQELRAIKISYLIFIWKYLKVRAWLEYWREDCSWRTVHSHGWRGEGVNVHGWDAKSGLNHFDSCCCSVAKSRPILCDLMNCNTPGSSVVYYLPEFAQIHVHWVSDDTT